MSKLKTTIELGKIHEPPKKPDYTPGPVPFTVLPYIKGTGKKRNCWNVKPTDDYGYACRKESEYAAHFIQYLQDNPFWVGSGYLTDIVKDMEFSDVADMDASKGYYIGFFSYIEKILWNFSQQNDAWKYFEQNDEHSRQFAIKY